MEIWPYAYDRVFYSSLMCALEIPPGGGGGVHPNMGYIGMCGPKGSGFSAVLFINLVSILAILPPF